MSQIDFSESDLFRVRDAKLNEFFSGDKLKTVEWNDYWLHSQFEKTAALLRAMVRAQKKFLKASDGEEDNLVKNDIRLDINNIVAFSGERGSGKSTFLYTVTKHLSKNKILLDSLADEYNKKHGHSEQENTQLQFSRFHVLPALDPNKLIEGESLLGHVVAQIYREMQKMADRQSGSLDDFAHLVRLCESTYDAIRLRLTPLPENLNNNPDDLEMLGKLSNTSNLKGHLAELVREFLKVVSSRSLGRGTELQDSVPPFLVIPIDDLDTCTKSGYELAEEIRNFFFIPQVIILMAVKIEQLVDVVHQHFINAFRALLDPDNLLDAQPEEMATKYIQKLIPDQRRVHLPSLTADSIRNVEIKTARQREYIPVADYFIALIWNKTRIILTKNAHSSHGLIPLNLRSLHQTLCGLEELPDVKIYPGVEEGNATARQALERNLAHIEEWLLDSVSSNAVPRGMALIFRQLVNHSNANFCGFLYSLLMQYEGKLTIKRFDIKRFDKESRKPILWGLWGGDPIIEGYRSEDVRPENISLGDILCLLDAMERCNSHEGIVHFAASVRMLISIRLTRILVKDKNPNYHAAFDLINGMVYNPKLSLTVTRQEWNPSSDISSASLSLGDKAYYFNGQERRTNSGTMPENGETQKVDRIPPMSLDDAVWLSMHVVRYGEFLRKGQLSMHQDGAYVRTKMIQLSDDGLCFVSISWLAFIANTLIPEETVSRLLAMLPGDQNKYLSNSLLYENLIKWKNSFRTAIPIHSIDLVSSVINTVHEYRFDTVKSETIYKLNSFFEIVDHFNRAMESIIEKTALCENRVTENKMHQFNNQISEMILSALTECPVFQPDNAVVQDYRMASEADRKFDWISD